MPFHHWSIDSSPKVETALFYHKPQLDLPGMRTGAYLNQDGSGRERVPEPGSPSTLISCCWVDSQWLKPSSLQVAHFSLKDSQAYWPSYFFSLYIRSNFEVCFLFSAARLSIRHCRGSSGVQPCGSDSSLVRRWRLCPLSHRRCSPARRCPRSTWSLSSLGLRAHRHSPVNLQSRHQFLTQV